MISVKKLNLEKHIKNVKHPEYTSFKSSELGLIEGVNKYIIVDKDAIHDVIDFKNSIEIELYGERIDEITHNKIFSIFPDRVMKLSYDEIKECPYENIPCYQFIRMFSSRIESNFGILMDSCEEIGMESTKEDRELRFKAKHQRNNT